MKVIVEGSLIIEAQSAGSKRLKPVVLVCFVPLLTACCSPNCVCSAKNREFAVL